MQRNSINQDNDRIGSNGYRQMNQGYDRTTQGRHDDHRSGSQRFRGNDDDRYGSNRSFGGYDDNRSGNRSFGGYDDNRFTGNQTGYDRSGYRGSESGYGGSQFSGYRGTDDRSHRSYGYDDRGFSGRNDERHPHDEHERGRWGTDYEGGRGHRYQGGMIDDNDRYRRDEAEFQRSGYQSHGFYDRNRSGRYQDRDEQGRFNDTGEGRRDSYRDDDRYRMDRDDRSRYASDDTRRYGHPGYGYGSENREYGRGGYGRDDRQFDEQRGYGGSVSNDRHVRDDYDRRWTGGGYEEDRRGRGRGRY
jgi:hypothetical protein